MGERKRMTPISKHDLGNDDDQGTLKLYKCTDHDNFWPVGCASIVLAHDEDEARGLLREALNDHGLNGDEPFTLDVVRMYPRTMILWDGNY